MKRKIPFEQEGIAVTNSLCDAICARIENEICHLQLAPNEVLNVNALADSYNVSRTTIRAALNVLSARGILMTNNSGKFIVPALNYEELINILDARNLCEHRATLLQCEVATDSDIDKFYSMAFNIQKSIRDQKYRQAVVEESEFHKSIVSTCGNQFIVTMYNSIFPIIGKYISYAEFALEKTEKIGFTDLVSNSHVMIVDAIKSRMPQNVNVAIKIHSEAVSRIMLYPGDQLYFDR